MTSLLTRSPLLLWPFSNIIVIVAVVIVVTVIVAVVVFAAIGIAAIILQLTIATCCCLGLLWSNSDPR